MPTEYPERWETGGLQNSGVGPDLASATSISPTYGIHRVTGTAAIATIVPPWPGFSGVLWLIPMAAFTTVATDNIGLASTGVVGKALGLVYHPSAGKWYPLY